MKTWKKLLACVLAAALALAMLTACGGGMGGIVNAGIKHSTQDDAAALCDKLGVTYDASLSSDAYSIANWIAAKSVSLKETAAGLERVETTDAVSLTLLENGDIANGLEQLAGTSLALDSELTIGLGVATDMYANQAVFTVFRSDAAAAKLKSYAAGNSRIGVAYIIVGENTYVVAVFM